MHLPESARDATFDTIIKIESYTAIVTYVYKSFRSILRAAAVSVSYPEYGRFLIALATSNLVRYVENPNWMVGVSLKMMTATRTLPLSTSNWTTTLTRKSNSWRYLGSLIVAELSTTNTTSTCSLQPVHQFHHYHTSNILPCCSIIPLSMLLVPWLGTFCLHFSVTKLLSKIL